MDRCSGMNVGMRNRQDINIRLKRAREREKDSIRQETERGRETERKTV